MQDETIFCVSTVAWHALWRSTQQIAARLAQHNGVFYFEPGRDPERSALGEAVRNVPHLWRLASRPQSDRLTLVPTPPSLPHARRHLPRAVLRVTMPLVIGANAALLARQVRRIREHFAVERPILWLYSPYHVGLIGECGEKLVCYYNYDEYADFAFNRRIRDLLRQLDDTLTRRADVVFASSRAQADRRRPLNPNTHFIPNGVDFDLFHQALDPDLPLPDDIASLPRPIIGFCGWLGYHIDVALLRRVAQAYPDCTLALVGPDELPDSDELHPLRAQANVAFLGRKPRAALPGYLKAFDAALMPWALSGHIRSAYPVKLHEYLAAGRAIVAVDLPELQPYAHVLRIASDHDEFVQHVAAALDDHEPQAVVARVAVAEQNTWEHRIAAIYRVLDGCLGSTRQAEEVAR
jgi:glycosyltransferase involved in cell wall biosynthesis